MKPKALPSLTLHLGLPKCASTSLQGLFSQANMTYFYLGKFKRSYNNLAYPNLALEEIFRNTLPLAYEMNLNYDDIEFQLARSFNEFNPQDRPVLLSEELMSGCGFLAHHKDRQVDPFVILYRLRKLFPRVQLLVVVREQFSLLKSYYVELVSQGYNLTYDCFVKKQLTGNTVLGNILLYDNYFSFLKQHCDEVYMVPFESLVNSDALASEFMANLGIPFFSENFPKVRKSASLNEAHQMLCANLSQLTHLGSLQSIYDISTSQTVIDMQEVIQEPEKVFWLEQPRYYQALNMFRTSNLRLMEMLKIDLKKYGYV